MTKQKFAQIISSIGHPMLTFPVFIIVILFWNESFEKALWISGLIILGIFIPMFIKMFRGTKSEKYTNFDISDQKQRKSFYPFIIILLSIVIAILFFTKQPGHIILPLFWGLILIFTNYILNFFIKVSLHVSLTVFLGFLIFSIQPMIGIGFFIFGILMAWSRLELKRHSIKEILLGVLVGLVIGSIYMQF